MITGVSTSSAIRSTLLTASASSWLGRVLGWEPGPMCPAALASSISASMTPLFSQWMPVMPPTSFIRCRAKNISF